MVLLALLLRDSHGLSAGGSGFLALVAYGITTFVVWLLYDFTQQYMSLGLLIVTGALLLSATAVVILLLAEAHEWAESLWLRQGRRQPLPLRQPQPRRPTAKSLDPCPHLQRTPRNGDRIAGCAGPA